MVYETDPIPGRAEIDAFRNEMESLIEPLTYQIRLYGLAFRPLSIETIMNHGPLIGGANIEMIISQAKTIEVIMASIDEGGIGADKGILVLPKIAYPQQPVEDFRILGYRGNFHFGGGLNKVWGVAPRAQLGNKLIEAWSQFDW